MKRQMTQKEVDLWFKGQEIHLGPFRWRGHLNWKDILERAIGGSMAGFTAGGTFFLLSRFFE